MNERIKELAEEAGYNIEELTTQEQMVAEKFAELIARECANLCQQEADKEFNNAWERVRAACDAQMILTHFGVEE
jgi:hypothetical protein